MGFGFGPAVGPYYNDAFYVYTSDTPYHDPSYCQLKYGTSPLVQYSPVQDAVNTMLDGVPANNPHHDYTFVLDTGLAVPLAQHFGVSDGIFVANTGDYTITITQTFAPAPAPLSLALLGIGWVGLTAIRHRPRQMRAVRAMTTPV